MAEQERPGQGYQLPAVAWEVMETEDSRLTVGAPEAPATEARPVRGSAPEVPGPQQTEPASATESATESVGERIAAVATAAAQEEAAEPDGRPGRISKPMIAAAVTVGLVLTGLPLVISQLGGSGGHHGPKPPSPAGFSQPDGGSGFVPGFDGHGNTDAPAADAAAGLLSASPAPGAPAPTTAAAATTDPGHQPDAHAGATTPAASGGGSSGGGAGSTQPSTPAKATFAAVAGPWCADGGTGFHQSGWFDDGQSGWFSTDTGGWTGDNCRGKYTAMPMSGAPDSDAHNSVLWTFSTGPVSTGSCRLSVYVPDDGDIKAVGGAPAYYTVQNSLTKGSGTIGSFTIDQPGNHGRWVSVGTFPVGDGWIAVMLHDRGKDWTGNGHKTYAHDAADAVRAECTAS